MTRHCLVVEDERALGEMICDNLGLDGHGAELVRSGDEALTRLERGGVDLVVLDIMLPGTDGFGVLRRMRARGDETPVLVLSARASDADRIRGLECQADDYLTKPFHLRELLLRVAALLRRHRPPAPAADLLTFGGNEVNLRSLKARTWRGDEVDLTLSEARLLRLLASREGTVVPRREVVEQMFGRASAPTTRTVDNVVLRLRKLFDRTGGPSHLHTVRGVGLRFTR